MNDTTVHGTLERSIAYTFRVFRISASFELRSIGHSVVVIRPNSHLLFLFLHAHHSYYTLCYFGY